MIEFTVLAFGMCAVLLHHPTAIDEIVGIGNLKRGGDECELSYIANVEDSTVSLQGHTIDVATRPGGMAVTVDGKRFFVPRGEKA